MEKYNVTAVSYLNTKPLLYGIFKSEVSRRIHLQLDIPSACARKLKTGEVDLGLVPVAVIPELATPRIVSDFCIGTVGEVRTVAIFSEKPIEQLRRIFLDYHSRTSVELTKLLLRDHWRLSPELTPAQPGFESAIGGNTGGLVIGDRTIELAERFPFVYDLGSAWMQHTGLPFVFAAWVSNRALPDDFIQAFNQALQRGLDEIPQLMYLLPTPQPGFDLQTYFTRHISYELDEKKKIALRRFLNAFSSRPLPTLAASLAVG